MEIEGKNTTSSLKFDNDRESIQLKIGTENFKKFSRFFNNNELKKLAFSYDDCGVVKIQQPKNDDEGCKTRVMILQYINLFFDNNIIDGATFKDEHSNKELTPIEFKNHMNEVIGFFNCYIPDEYQLGDLFHKKCCGAIINSTNGF